MNKDIQLPNKEDESFNVIQLYIDSSPILKIGSPYSIHGKILEETLKEYGIIDFKKEKIMGDYIPALLGARYRLVGAGSCMKSGEIVRFYGESSHYRIGIYKSHLDACNYLIHSTNEKLTLEN